MEGPKKKSLWHFLSKKRLTSSTGRQQNSPDLTGISSYETSTSSSIHSARGISLHAQSESIGPSSASTEFLTGDGTPNNGQKESSTQLSQLNALCTEALGSSEYVNNSEMSQNVNDHAVRLLQSHIQNLKSAAASSVDEYSRDDIPHPPDRRNLPVLKLNPHPPDRRNLPVLKLNRSSTLLFRILSVLSDQWNPDIDLPKLDRTNLDESIENARSTIQKIIDANDQAKAEEAVKTGILHTFAENAKSICIHLKPFFKTFLSVAILGSAIPILNPYGLICGGLSLLINTFDVDNDRKRVFELQLEDAKEELERLALVKEIPGDLRPGFRDRVEANAFEILSSLLNLVGKNVSYFATFARAGRTFARTARLSKTLVTDIQNVYGDAKNDLVRNLAKFDKTLQDAGLLLIRRVDDNTITILNNQEAEMRRRILDWLSPGCFSDTYDIFQSKRAESSGKWFLKLDKFQAWENGTSNLLIVTGMAGAGKSHLTTAVIEHLKGSDTKPIYIYFDLKRQETQTADNVASSLLKQIGWPPQKERPGLKVIYENIPNENERPSRDTIVSLFIKCAHSLKVRVLFDALDECKDEELGKIYGLVERLREANVGVYITTRSHVEGHLIQRFGNDVFLKDIKADEKDICNFLQRRIQSNREYVAPDFMNEITHKIGDAQGIFLLAFLQVEHVLRGRGQGHMQKLLKTMPSTIDEAFKTILKRIEQLEANSAATARQTLTWVYYAQRPLKMDELLEALSVEENDRDRKDNTNNAISVIDCCLSFVTHDEASGDVRFVHPSVQRWFDSEPQQKWLFPELYLAKICLTYLCFDIFENKVDEWKSSNRSSYIFYHYAAQCWGGHTRRAEDDPTIQRSALAFLESENKRNYMLRVAHTLDYYLTRQSALHICAGNGLEGLCRILLNADCETKAVIPASLREEVDVHMHDGEGRTALHYAATVGYERVVQILLDANAEIDRQDDDGLTALHCAAGRGHVSVVHTLVDAVADVDKQDNDGETALHRVAYRGLDRVVQILVDAKAEVDKEDNQGATALHWAASCGYDRVVRILVDIKAEIDKPDHVHGQTALHRAAVRGHDRVVRILVDAKAEVDKEDDDGYTALQHAAIMGHDRVVHIFVDAKAEVEKGDNHGYMALHCEAPWRGGKD